MAVIVPRKVRNGVRYQARVRLKGLTKSMVFDSHDAAARWAGEQEALVRSGKTAFVGEALYLHVATGKPRTIVLRPYQADAIRAVHASITRSPSSAPLVSLPTGSGKTVVIAGLIEHFSLLKPGARFLVVTTSAELVSQNHAEYLAFSSMPESAVGILAASAGRYDLDCRVAFGTIQTLSSRSFAAHVDYIIIDEAHLLPPREFSMYRRMLSAAFEINPGLRLIGMTATPYRMDSGMLTEGPAALFSEVCYEANIAGLIRDGYLCRLISQGSEHHVNDAELVVAGNDFEERSAERAMLPLTDQILSDVMKRSAGRNCWLVYCVSIHHANVVNSKLRALGVPCEVVSSAETLGHNADAIKALRERRLRALVSVNSLTTGINVQQVDQIISLRPTRSRSLWVQICGRGMRVFAGKADCIVLDYANNIARHGPINAPISSVCFGKPGASSSRLAPFKCCPACRTECHPALHVCPNCGSLLSDGDELQLSTEASSLPVLLLDNDVKSLQARLRDIGDLMVWYVTDDVRERLKDALAAPGHRASVLRYLRIYETLRQANMSDDGLECGLSCDELARLLGRSGKDLAADVESGVFPRPRVLLDDGSGHGYSVMQTAVIMAGDAARLVEFDDTFLMYLYIQNDLVLRLSLSGDLMAYSNR